MAATYDVIGNNVVVEFIPPNKSRDVHEVAAMAQPSGVVFYVRFPKEAYTPATVGSNLGSIAAVLNSIANTPGVAGIAIEQDIDAAGNTVEYGTVTVESSSGLSSDTIRDVQTWLFLSTFGARIAAAVAKLDAIEAL